jgi:hypothetical protein
MEQEKYPVVVIFRKFKDEGDILALFPYEKHNGYLIMSYQHIGQHGGADYNHCMKETIAAKPEEYASLQKELESLGYDLIIRKKRVQKPKVFRFYTDK